MVDFNKHWRPSRPETIPPQLAGRAEDLKVTLRSHDPALVAARSGASYLIGSSGKGQLCVPLLGDVYTLSWPELLGVDLHNKALPDFQLTLLLYYLTTADGTAAAGKWVSFAELPGGRVYDAAFQGYSGDQLVKSFGDNLDDFRDACTSAGAKEFEMGSCSFIFACLPFLPMMVTYWLGDEQFPSSCKILFDESACHYLPIDASAILGSMLTRKLIKLRRSTSKIV